MKNLFFIFLVFSLLFVACTPSVGSTSSVPEEPEVVPEVPSEPETPSEHETPAEPENPSKPEVPTSEVNVYESFPYSGEYGSVSAIYAYVGFLLTGDSFTILYYSEDNTVDTSDTYNINQVIETPSKLDWLDVTDYDPALYKHYFISLLKDDTQYYAAITVYLDPEHPIGYVYLKHPDDWRVEPVQHSYVEPSQMEKISPRSLLFDMDAPICCLYYKSSLL